MSKNSTNSGLRGMAAARRLIAGRSGLRPRRPRAATALIPPRHSLPKAPRVAISRLARRRSRPKSGMRSCTSTLPVPQGPTPGTRRSANFLGRFRPQHRAARSASRDREVRRPERSPPASGSGRQQAKHRLIVRSASYSLSLNGHRSPGIVRARFHACGCRGAPSSRSSGVGRLFWSTYFNVSGTA